MKAEQRHFQMIMARENLKVEGRKAARREGRKRSDEIFVIVFLKRLERLRVYWRNG